MGMGKFYSCFKAIRAIRAVKDEPLRPTLTFWRGSGRVWQLAVRTGVIHSRGKLLRQNLGDLIDRDVELGRQLLDRVAAKHLVQLLGRNRQVLPASDPGFHLIA